MAAETEALDELHRLRSRIPQLTGALAASVDGLVLAHDAPGVEPEGVAALTAASLGVAVRMTDATARGGFRELLVRGEHGYVATYAAGPSAVLTLLAEDRVNVGRLHLEGRRSGRRIAEILAAATTAAAAGDRAVHPPKTMSAARSPGAAGETGGPDGTGRTTPSGANQAGRPVERPSAVPSVTPPAAPPLTPSGLPLRTPVTEAGAPAAPTFGTPPSSAHRGGTGH
ncbi:roadblock/LC7 domain-containing protein [Streptomyces minutiscleroticus]|uniref:Roadblock/LAMTOR2 domain-containing protein n=1 Tax=Streptomyces minutiscleroticus TaxID=68238 RepID=A0A918NP36_9ACTN|nr:hypothetical protein GCM10010358_43040 [Streptomyces minutiscleroticus]